VTRVPNEKDLHIAMMKGAPEIVLTHCTHYFYNDQVHTV
jgi:magnesium-transporting ATPase (P-type)